MSFFSELKRRNVFRAGAAYLVVAWGLLQAVAFVLDMTSAPKWILQVFVLAATVGLPAVLVFSWAFEMTPEGVKRESEIDRTQSVARQTGRKLSVVIVVFLLLAVALLLAGRFMGADRTPAETVSAVEPAGGRKAASESVSTENSIAVLPFRDMSAAGDQAYFGEGIAEELLDALVKLDGLKVASRTSTFSLMEKNLDVPTIAGLLHVSHILAGSVRTSGKKIRVTAQLIDVRADKNLWSETYDGSLEDIFKIQDEISSKIVNALKVQLGDQVLLGSAKKLTENAEAYRLYLQGRHLWRQRNAAALQKAIGLFRRAVTLDPQFHQAWSNLGIALFNLPTYDHSFDETEYFARSIEAADIALSIEPRSTEALLLKANFHEFNCQFNDAAIQYERAIASAPDDPTAHHWYASLLAYLGHSRRALEQIQTAHRLDPELSAVINTEGLIHLGLGNYDQATELIRQAASQGIYGGSLFEVGLVYLSAGDLEKARPFLAPGRNPNDAEQLKTSTLFLAALDDPKQWSSFEDYIGLAKSGSRLKDTDRVFLLTAAGSPYVFDYLAKLECPYTDTLSAYWSESFRQQRSTPAFFHLMERAGAVKFWRQFGWPDDCASLDQNLAKCH